MMKLVFLLSCTISTISADRVISTDTGQVQGITVTKGNPSIESFLGIPYAEPPIGDLRFKRPVPKKPWSGVYTAFKLSPVCMQIASDYYYEPNTENMTEDCLHLNMWVPYSATPGDLKTIMVFIHGGAFVMGGTNMQLYDGTSMAHKGDVIVASVNYRLGAFGFLYLDTEEADGNMGIFDVILSIKWIKKNAKAFGGDPDKIVLFGESAGSMIISCLLSSPLTRHLFKRAILQSGTFTMPLSLDNNTITTKMSTKLAEATGCSEEGTTPQDLIACLRNVPSLSMAKTEDEVRKTHHASFLPRTGDDFLPKPLMHFLKEGDFQDTEILIGNNEAEGTFFLAVSAPDVFGEYGSKRVNLMSKKLANHLLRKVLKAIGIGQDEKQIAQFYIGSIEGGSSQIYLDAIARAVGDFFITSRPWFDKVLGQNECLPTIAPDVGFAARSGNPVGGFLVDYELAKCVSDN